MQLFIDTANLKEIEQMKDFIDGVTTNPSLVSKENSKENSKEKNSFKESLKLISQMIDGPISAEVISTEFMSMLKEAFELAKISENIVIKLPMTEDGLKASKALYQEGIKTNVTLCFTANQALLAAKAFATYVSPFIGRLEDIGENGIQLIEDIVKIYDNYEYKTKIISASIRKPKHVSQVAKAKSHVATIPYNILKQLIKHPLTDKGIEIFIKDWQESGLNI